MGEDFNQPVTNTKLRKFLGFLCLAVGGLMLLGTLLGAANKLDGVFGLMVLSFGVFFISKPRSRISNLSITLACILAIISFASRLRLPSKSTSVDVEQVLRGSNEAIVEAKKIISEIERSSKAANRQPTELTILHWNVESGGNDPALIGKQLVEMIEQGRYDIVGLSEVHDPEPYEDVLKDDFSFIRGETGFNNGRENDRLLLAYRK